MSAKAEMIVKRFFDAMKATAEGHGLFCTGPKVRRADHELFISEGSPPSGKRLWLLYNKASLVVCPGNTFT